MISVKVTYQIKPSFLEENKQNIQAFLMDFKHMQTTRFLYHVYLKEDGATFVHISMYDNADIQKQVLATPSFLHFQQQRDQHGSTEQVEIETLTHLGSSLGLIK